MTSPEDEVQVLRQRARDMETIRQLTQQDENDTVSLLQKLDGLATELFEYASNWDDIDSEISAHVRQQVQQLHAIRARAVQLAEDEAADMSAIVAEVNKVLKQIRGGGS
jgi:hypothetical protein